MSMMGFWVKSGRYLRRDIFSLMIPFGGGADLVPRLLSTYTKISTLRGKEDSTEGLVPTRLPET